MRDLAGSLCVPVQRGRSVDVEVDEEYEKYDVGTSESSRPRRHHSSKKRFPRFSSFNFLNRVGLRGSTSSTSVRAPPSGGASDSALGAVAAAMPPPTGRPAKDNGHENGSQHQQQHPAVAGLDAKEALKRAAVAKAAVIATSASDKDTHVLFSLLREAGVDEVASVVVSEEARQHIHHVTKHTAWPLVYVKGDAVGGVDELTRLAKGGVLSEWLKDHDYDLVVIGGGSGGLAAAKEAARLGKKVACLDFVKPSPAGSTWGLGGTCVNVGCIPKKLMHTASMLGHSIKDAKKYGWKVPAGDVTHNWTTMKDAIQDHIASLNWGYRVQLREKTVTYVNGYGAFTGSHEITSTNKKGKQEKLTADRFLISTGLRPKHPDIPGAKEYCISSDDLFALPYAPGKTLCVGASYVSLECAGFLKGIGFDTTVMVRSILLRGFDQDMAERIRKHMIDYGMRFESGVPSRIEEIEPKTKKSAGLLRVYWQKTNEDGTKEETSEDFNTVLMAIGREAVTDDVNLDSVGVERAKSKKVVGRREQSSTPYIYAIGDVLEGTPELTPVAIQAGRVLMRRVFHGTDELTEYHEIPTTVFTPLEYGSCGYAEEDAIKIYGKDNIVVYHNMFTPLEYTVAERTVDSAHCYLKLICNKADDERVVGFHILTPWAGEVTQGFAIGFKLGAKKVDFDRLIGIHPTVAENFTTLTIVKREGAEELKASGC